MNFSGGLGFGLSIDAAEFLSTIKEASSALDQLAGMVNNVSDSAGGGKDPFAHFATDESLDRMREVDTRIEDIASSLEVDLDRATQRSARRFRAFGDVVQTIANGISRAFQFVGSAVSSVGVYLSKTFDFITNLISKIPLPHLGEMAGNLSQKMGQLLTHTGTLTTGFEAQAQAASVSARSAVANYGIFGKELDKTTAQAAGLILGMKISSQAAADATSSTKVFGKELAALGINSAKAAAELEAGANISVKDLGFNFHQLSVQLGLTPAELKAVSQGFTRTGETIHDMSGALANLPKLAELAAGRASLIAQGISSIGGKESIDGVNRAISALYILTGDSKNAQATALALEDAFIKSGQNFSNMFAGTSGDIDKTLTSLSIVQGDVNDAFQSIGQGSDVFVDKFAYAIRNAKKEGKDITQVIQFFAGQMHDFMSEDAVKTLVTGIYNMDDAKAAMIQTSKALGKDLNQVRKETYRTTQTLQERFDLLEGSALASFRSIGHAAAETFVTQTGATMMEFAERAKDLAADGGPLGLLVSKLSEMHHLGVRALLPEFLQPFVGTLGLITKEIVPLITTAAAFGFRLDGLSGAFVAATAGAVGFYAVLKSQQIAAEKADKNLQMLKHSAEALDKKHAKAGGGAAGDALAAASVSAWEKYAAQKKAIDSKSLKASADTIKAWGMQALDGIKSLIDNTPAVLRTFGEVFDRINSYIDWDKVWQFVQDGALKAFKVTKDFFAGIIDGYRSGLDPSSSDGKSNAHRLGAVIGDFLWTAFHIASEGYDKYVKPIIDATYKGFLDGWHGKVTGKAGAEGVGNDIGNLFNTALEEAQKKVSDYCTTWWGDVAKIWSNEDKTFLDKVTATGARSAGFFAAGFALQKFTPIFDIFEKLTAAAGLLGLAFVGLFFQTLGFLVEIELLSGGMAILVAMIVIGTLLFIAMGVAIGGLVVLAMLFPDEMRKALDTVCTLLESSTERIVTAIGDAFLDGKSPEEAGTKWAERFLSAIAFVFVEIPNKLESALFIGIGKGLDNLMGHAVSSILGEKSIEDVVKKFGGTTDDLAKSTEKATEATKPMEAALSTATTALQSSATAGDSASKAMAAYAENVSSVVKASKDMSTSLQSFSAPIDVTNQTKAFTDIASTAAGSAPSLDKYSQAMTTLSSALPGTSMESLSSLVKDVTKDTGSMTKLVTQESRLSADKLISTFDVTYKGIDIKQEAFLTSQVGMFQKLTDSIYFLFNHMWQRILQDTEDSTKAMEATLGTTLAELRKVQTAVGRTSGVREESTKGYQPGEITKRDDSKSELLNVFDAIHRPDWWAQPGGYKDLFQDGVAAIVLAVGSSPITQTGGTSAGVKALQLSQQSSPSGNTIPNWQIAVPPGGI